MSKRLKIGVVGAGVFGGYHAQKCADHPLIDYIGSYDPTLERAESIAAPRGGQGFECLETLIGACEALIIACPASQHGSAAIAALSAGKHCLIEKPIAHELGEADEIIRIATEHDLVVQVGHQERIVAQAIGLTELSHPPSHIWATRNCQPSPRCIDVSVTLDLMTHDLDLCKFLTGQQGQLMSAKTQSHFTPLADETHASLSFGKTKVELSSNRNAVALERHMTLRYPEGDVEIDFVAKTITAPKALGLNQDFFNAPAVKDSLGAATDYFVNAVLYGKGVLASSQDGRDALALALQIDGG